ncbi:MAG TPA: ABC transporter permease [Candidatus Angelobacter sp.]|nr:ABC transporter permease [Candidatus Angelobacter sp.]
MQSFLHDVRYALRTLARNRRFALVAVLTLGLGLGVTVAMFSVVEGVLLRSLPYKDPDRLVFISQTDGPGTKAFPISSPGHFRDYREQARQFEGFAAGFSFLQTLESTENGAPAQQVEAAVVTANFFPVLGVTPVLGRNFLPEEEVVNGPQVAILSDRLWRRRYGADATLVGRSLRMNGQNVLVAGILPPNFKLYLPAERIFLRDAEVWFPAQIDYAAAAARRQAGFLAVIGKLKQGATIRSAQAEMDRIAEGFRRDYRVDKMADLRVQVVSMLGLVVKHVRTALLTIMAVVGLVLIIACANVANLCLARGAERQKEIAIRTALGASRTRVIRQILTESLVLSFFGLLAGLVFAYAGLKLLWFLRPTNLPRLEDIRLDGTAMAFAVGATLLTALLFGALPALAASPEALKEGGRDTGGVGRRSVRAALIVGEIAASLVLLLAAGLLLRSFAALQRVETGFTRGSIFTFQVALPFPRYNAETTLEFYQNLERELRAIPGVESVGAINLLPLGSTSNPFGWATEAAPDQWAAQAADARIVTPGYFNTMGIKLISGRFFTEQDDLKRPLEVVVDDVMARRAWPGANPIGQKVNMTTFHQNSPPTKEWWQVIGVVEHVHNESLTEEGMLQIYRPLLQDLNGNMTMVVRSAGGGVGIERAAEAALRKLDKEIPLYQPQTLDGYIRIAQAPMVFNLILIGSFAVMALVLASVGLYGVIAYLVSQRTREIGVRIALGAQRDQILRLILGYGLKLTLIGLAAGVLISLAISRVISSQLFGVRATDFTTFILTPVVLAAIALLASYVPSRRAAHLDPMQALRHDGQ